MTDTVHVHRQNDTIRVRQRTTVDDLWFAVEWLEAYEGDVDDDRENLESLAAVADFLRKQIARRNK